MTITVLGWYGTETIGDRAILLGIASIFGSLKQKISIQLGSLYPFYTEKTIEEDRAFFNLVANHEDQFSIRIFNSKSAETLKENINRSDLVLVGGGPLMHINPMFMLAYGFRYAKKKGIQTMILGCGVGPLFKKKHIKATEKLLKYADFVVFREAKSEDYLKKIGINQKADHIGIDPAVIATLKFKAAYVPKNNDSEPVGVMCLRSFPSEYSEKDVGQTINAFLENQVCAFADAFDHEIRLLPMHYFHVGGDDRLFLSEVAHQIQRKNVKLQAKPLNTFETMELMHTASFCVGMRFHSVVLETILNPNVYIMDYTEPKIGKISGYLDLVTTPDQIKNRYVNLQKVSPTHGFDFESPAFTINEQILQDKSKLLQETVLGALK